MKVAMVCPRGVPPIRGGAERLWDGIVREINARTPHHAELIAIDAPEATLPDVVHSYARFDALDLAAYDLVISSKYPAWMIKHPRHVVYMAHPLRGLYDTYAGALPMPSGGTSSQARSLFDTLRIEAPGLMHARRKVLHSALAMVDELPPDHPDLAFPGPLARQLVRWLDRDALDPVNTSAHLAISRTVARRDGYFPDRTNVEVVIPPSSMEGLESGVGRHLFTASRLDHPKRIDVLIDAMAHVTGDVELRIAGTGPQERALRERSSHDARVRFLGHIDDDQLLNEYSSAIAVPFIPMDEDLGLITLEAQMSHKPVVTCRDSGGPTELVDDGVEGFVVDPTARHIGQALQRLVSDRALAEDMGRRGFDRARRVTWDRVLEALLRDRRGSDHRSSDLPHVLVLSTYPAEPARHGGQIRLSRLLRSLATRAHVNLMVCGSGGHAPTELNLPFGQTVVSPDAGYYSLDHYLAVVTGVPTGDIAAALAGDGLGDLQRLAAAAASDADIVVLAQPYLFPLISEIEGACIVYDAQNAEFELKRSMYPSTEAGNAVADAVREVEAATVRRAALVTCASADDLDTLRRLTPTLADFEFVSNGTDALSRPFVTGVERRLRRDAYLEVLRGQGLETPASSIALFVGSGHPPNVQAALRTLEIAQSLPSILFVMAGAHVDALPGVPLGGNVLALGMVGNDELDRLLSCCDVALNPMATGSGTNIKMLDYFAAGAPVVSTSVGARGLGATPGLHYVDTELDGLAEAVLAVVNDPDAADDRAGPARALAESLDWTALGDQFTDAVLRVAAEWRRGGLGEDDVEPVTTATSSSRIHATRDSGNEGPNQ
jgi:glycosyltransferase involved in cell wall biosynthesis